METKLVSEILKEQNRQERMDKIMDVLFTLMFFASMLVWLVLALALPWI